MAENEVTTEVKKRKKRGTRIDWLKDIIANGTEEQKTKIDNLISEYKQGLELKELKRQRDDIDAKIKKLENNN